jgi:hypothetical protein
MKRFARIAASFGLIALVGAGCGGSTDLFTTTGGNASGSSDLNLPGVPYGTYKDAKSDLQQAQQAEHTWQAGTAAQE